MPGRRSRRTAASIPTEATRATARGPSWGLASLLDSYEAVFTERRRVRDAIPARSIAPGQWYLDIPEDAPQPLMFREGEPPPVADWPVRYQGSWQPQPDYFVAPRATTAPLSRGTFDRALAQMYEDQLGLLQHMLYGSPRAVTTRTARVTAVNPQAGSVTIEAEPAVPFVKDETPCVYDPTLEFDDR